MKKYLITAPEGMIIDEHALKENKIEFIPENQLPKEWELEPNKQYFSVSDESRIAVTVSFEKMTHPIHYNALPTKELAKAMLSLCKLLVMRDRYNAGWVPDWNDSDACKYTIMFEKNKVRCVTIYVDHVVLAFKTVELRDQFFRNFKEDIEIAKPLL